MTNLPDWLVERVALDEVAPHHAARVDHADREELAARVAALEAENAAELAAYPPGPAVAQIEAQVKAQVKARGKARRRWIGMVGVATSAVTALVIAWVVVGRSPHAGEMGSGSGSGVGEDVEVTRVKGSARLLAFRLAGDRIEQLAQDSLVRGGDVLQLRYNPGGKRHGVIASIDGAGVVTLHYPADEDASTQVATHTTTLPNAYALDDAPRFERFFFLTANEPIDVRDTLAVLRSFAQREDSATATPELPDGVRLWSLRLRKPASPSK